MNVDSIAFVKAVLFTACVVYGISVPFALLTSSVEFLMVMTLLFLAGTTFAYLVIMWAEGK